MVLGKKGFREGFEVSQRKTGKKQARRRLRLTEKDLRDPRVRAGLEVGELARTLQEGQDFSPEQEALRQTFGGGEKIWGINQNPVNINNDLNPSMRDPYNETASMFGFGMRNERSGLF